MLPAVHSLAKTIVRSVTLTFLLPVLFAQQTPPPDLDPATGKRSLIQPEATKKTEPGEKKPGKTYALIVGISKYQNDPPVTSLQFADKDAESFAGLLQKPIAGEMTGQDQIRLLTNEHATRAAIDDAVREISKDNGAPENTLVIFVAAHGIYLKTEEDPDTHKTIQRDPYILTYDSNPQDAKMTGYPMDDFRVMVAKQAIQFGRVLVFLDVCHAGNVAGISGGGELEEVVKKVWEGRAGDLGVLLASHSHKFAVESASFGGGHGAFSYFVLAGMNGAAASTGETSISFADLAVYVIKNVRDFTRSQQIPDKSSTNDDMVVIPDTTKPGMTMPPATPLSEQEVRQLRSRGVQTPNNPQGAAKATQSADPFDAALARGVLLPEEPGSAFNLLNQPSQTTEALTDRQRRLRIALEDSGQQVMSKYLEGEEVPQTKAEFDRCARLFDTALQLDSTNTFDRSRSLFCQGRALVFAKQYDDAQRNLDQSIQLDSRRAYAYNALGIANLERIAGRGTGFDAASDAFRTAMRYAPYWAYPIHNLALTESERGNYDEAIRLYEYAITVAPRYSYLPYSLGSLYVRLGDFANARKWFDQARETLEQYSKPRNGAWPERARIWNALGTVARSQGREARALDFFQKAMADDPSDLNARHNLALIYAKRGDFTKADDLWRGNLDRDATFTLSRVSYAESLATRGQRREAIQQYERLVQDKPDYIAARESLARLYLAENDPSRALAELKPAIDQAPANPSLVELRGDIEAKLGDSASAKAAWQQALDASQTREAKTRIEKKLKSR
jgi:tetratricopeptide (TPR) repeat protein